MEQRGQVPANWFVDVLKLGVTRAYGDEAAEDPLASSMMDDPTMEAELGDLPTGDDEDLSATLQEALNLLVEQWPFWVHLKKMWTKWVHLVGSGPHLDHHWVSTPNRNTRSFISSTRQDMPFLVFGGCAFLPFSLGPPGDCSWRH